MNRKHDVAGDPARPASIERRREMIEQCLTSAREASDAWIRVCRQASAEIEQRAAAAEAWGQLTAAAASLQQLLEQMTIELEDEEDFAEARAAMEESGKSIPWEIVKTELGIG
ncbi:MAG: hypothetical protein ACR2PL_06035 [Dehalococcoidia bacterium]